MARPDDAAVVRAIEQLIDFLEKFGEVEQTRAARFRRFAERIKSEGLAKPIFREISRANDDASSQLDEQIWGGRTLPGKDQDQTRRELRVRCMAVNNVLFPIEPLPAELDISDFAGSENVTHKGVICRGNPSGAREVFERCIAFVQRYSLTFFFSTRRIAMLLFFFGSVRSDFDRAGFLAIVISNVEVCQLMCKRRFNSASITATERGA